MQFSWKAVYANVYYKERGAWQTVNILGQQMIVGQFLFCCIRFGYCESESARLRRKALIESLECLFQAVRANRNTQFLAAVTYTQHSPRYHSGVNYILETA